MKTISKAQWQSLEDLSAEGLLGGLPLQTAEKDIHITDLLKRLSTLDVRHDQFKGMVRGETSKVDDGIGLIFAGGTCLSKAHGLIHRMSEDVDIKVVLGTPTKNVLKAGVSYRARLKALHVAIAGVVSDMGLQSPSSMGGRDNPVIRDSHRYFVLGSQYESKAPLLMSLRPEIKLEVIHREPHLTPHPLTFGYLHERLASLPSTSPVSIPCIQVAETLAEKVLALLRRCAWKWGGHQKDEMDATLVRHIYDVHCIMRDQPQELLLAKNIFAALVAGDAHEFGGRDPDFEVYPKKTLMRTLETARSSDELQRGYAERLLPLIYEGGTVSFAEAFAGFEAAANELIAQL